MAATVTVYTGLVTLTAAERAARYRARKKGQPVAKLPPGPKPAPEDAVASRVKFTRLPVDQIEVGPRLRHDLGDLDGLVESVKTIGLLHPVVVGPEHGLIAGQRRLEAWKLARPGEPVPIHVVTAIDERRAELDENTQRLDLLPSEKVAVAHQYLEELARRPEAFPKPPKGEGPNYLAARAVGLSRPTLTKALLVHDVAEGHTLSATVQADDRPLFAKPTPALQKAAERIAAELDEHQSVERAYQDLRAVAEQEVGWLVPEVRDDEAAAPHPASPRKERRRTGEGEVAEQLAWRLVQTLRQLLRLGKREKVDVAACLAEAFAGCQDGGTGWASDAADLMFQVLGLLPQASAAFLSGARRLPYDASPEERNAAFGEAEDLAASTGSRYEVLFMRYDNEKFAADVAKYGLRDWEKAGEWVLRTYWADGTFAEHTLPDAVAPAG